VSSWLALGLPIAHVLLEDKGRCFGRFPSTPSFSAATRAAKVKIELWRGVLAKQSELQEAETHQCVQQRARVDGIAGIPGIHGNVVAVTYRI
jgi:hypothetical protein